MSFSVHWGQKRDLLKDHLHFVCTLPFLVLLQHWCFGWKLLLLVSIFWKLSGIVSQVAVDESQVCKVIWWCTKEIWSICETQSCVFFNSSWFLYFSAILCTDGCTSANPNATDKRNPVDNCVKAKYNEKRTLVTKYYSFFIFITFALSIFFLSPRFLLCYKPWRTIMIILSCVCIKQSFYHHYIIVLCATL